MPVQRIFADPGGEYLIPWVKRRLAYWHEEMLRAGVWAASRVVLVDTGTTIVAALTRVGADFVDQVRITVVGGWNFFVRGTTTSTGQWFGSLGKPLAASSTLPTLHTLAGVGAVSASNTTVFITGRDAATAALVGAKNKTAFSALGTVDNTYTTVLGFHAGDTIAATAVAHPTTRAIKFTDGSTTDDISAPAAGSSRSNFLGDAFLSSRVACTKTSAYLLDKTVAAGVTRARLCKLGGGTLLDVNSSTSPFVPDYPTTAISQPLVANYYDVLHTLNDQSVSNAVCVYINGALVYTSPNGRYVAGQGATADAFYVFMVNRIIFSNPGPSGNFPVTFYVLKLQRQPADGSYTQALSASAVFSLYDYEDGGAGARRVVATASNCFLFLTMSHDAPTERYVLCQDGNTGVVSTLHTNLTPTDVDSFLAATSIAGAGYVLAALADTPTNSPSWLSSTGSSSVFPLSADELGASSVLTAVGVDASSIARSTATAAYFLIDAVIDLVGGTRRYIWGTDGTRVVVPNSVVGLVADKTNVYGLYVSGSHVFHVDQTGATYDYGAVEAADTIYVPRLAAIARAQQFEAWG